MYRKLPSLSALNAFEAAAQLMSFKEAADRLCRTPSAVSHQIRGLERELGVALFHRERAGLQLTQAGREYFEAVHSALAALGEATACMRAGRVQDGRVTLSLFPSLAVRWLIPRLHAFRERYPEVEIELLSSLRPVDLDSGVVDAAIRFGTGAWPGMRCDPLMPEDVLPVCAPALARGPTPVRSASDLARVELLHNGAHPGEWRDWLARAGVEGVNPERGPVLDASNEVLAAAANGLGVALGRTPLVDTDLASGRLVAPIGGRVRSPGRYWLVAPQASADRPEVAAFREWLVELVTHTEPAGDRE
mgnify:CR=1 FL=1